ISADIDAHGALSRGTSLTLKGNATGDLIARELDFAGRPERAKIAAKITLEDNDVYLLDIAELEAGDLALTGKMRAGARFDGGYDLKGEGRLAGADRLVELDAETFLKDVGWRIDGRSNADFDA